MSRIAENGGPVRELSEGKIQTRHLGRKAVVYVRQSSPGQVARHRESTALQYDLQARARLLGWAADRIEVIDEDLGRTARPGSSRAGFTELVAGVGLGHVGIVLSWEVSRLARNLADWGRMLELCGQRDTLIGDCEVVYDLSCFNDRFILGIRGSMSEAELHLMRQRLHAGQEAKASRGALRFGLPRGYVHGPDQEIQQDPDEEVRASVRRVFDLFAKCGSLQRVVRTLAGDGEQLPHRARSGPGKGEVVWGRPSAATVYHMLTNPVYAGAYAWGRIRGAARGDDDRIEDRWRYLLRDRHPAYISWETLELNVQQLASNRGGPKGRSPGMLSGRLRCGRCGRSMMAGYNNGGRSLRYSCFRGRLDYGEAKCQSFSGGAIDTHVSREILGALAPAAVEASLAALSHVESERARQHEKWRQRLARVEHGVERAWRQFDAADPGNRLVAQNLEDQWEAALRAQARLREEYERFCTARPRELTEDQRRAIREAAEDVAGLWQGGGLPPADRIDILRLLVDRVIATVEEDSEQVAVEIQWQGGSRSISRIHRPVRDWRQMSCFPELQAHVHSLREQGRSYREIADQLNAEGWRPARRTAFTIHSVKRLCKIMEPVEEQQRRSHPPPADRRPDEWTLEELSGKLNIPLTTLYNWIQKGILSARRSDAQPFRGPRRWLIQANEVELDRIRKRRTDWETLHRDGTPRLPAATPPSPTAMN